MAKRTVDLSKSLSRIGAVLEEDLAIHANEMPLEIFTNEGGWPDTDTLQIEVKDVAPVDGKIRVRVGVTFDEIVPTGCADIKRNEDCFGSLDLWFDPAEEKPYFKWASDAD